MEPRRDGDRQHIEHTGTPAASVTASAAPATLGGSPSLSALPMPQPGVSAQPGTPLTDADWVEATERTIDQYSANPYALSEAVAKLRSSYLQQRYGRDLKSTE